MHRCSLTVWRTDAFMNKPEYYVILNRKCSMLRNTLCDGARDPMWSVSREVLRVE